MPINSKGQCSNTFHTSKMDVGCSQGWSIASTMSSCHQFIVATVTPNYQNLGQLCQCNNCVRVHPCPIQSIRWCSNIFFIWYWCGKQTVVVYSLNNVIMPSFYSHSDPKLPKSGQPFQCNCVRRVHPYAYQQQMMVLKHFFYIKYGCGEQSLVVYSLDNVIMPSFHSSPSDPKLPKSGPTLPV